MTTSAVQNGTTDLPVGEHRNTSNLPQEDPANDNYVQEQLAARGLTSNDVNPDGSIRGDDLADDGSTEDDRADTGAESTKDDKTLKSDKARDGKVGASR